jgi:glycosyltransferase involved in cell wall biosynthesis
MLLDNAMLVDIGMPVYNGGRFIEEALRSLSSQSFTEWKLVIADNASTDGTEEICREFSRWDSRIRYVRHESNIGAPANFKYVLDQAKAPYFMWAAADDLWGSEFISNCVRRLSGQKNIGMAFTGVDIIDSFGQVVRRMSEIPSFSGSSSLPVIAKFAWSPEFHGKANVIYSVFRTEVCKSAHRRYPFNMEWGGDMCFNLAALTLSGLDVTEEVHFFKRDARSTDSLGDPHPIAIPESLLERSCPLHIFPEYARNTLLAVRGTHFYPAVLAVMRMREWRLKQLTKKALGD